MPERLFLRLDEDPLHGPEADIPAGTLRAWPVRVREISQVFGMVRRKLGR